MGIFEENGDLPGDNDLANTKVCYRVQPFADPFPTSFGAAECYIGGPLHHYAKAILVTP
jgi:hypothetical protein